MESLQLYSRHHAALSPPPSPSSPALPTLYSMRFCPYSERVVLALLDSGKQFKLVHIDLSSKPQWFLALHPSGSVPVLQDGTRLIADSVAAAEHVAGQQLGEEDRLLVSWCSKCLRHLYSLAGVGQGGEVEAEAGQIARTGLTSSLVNLSLALRERGTDFYSGAEHGLVDLVLWSVVERLCLSGLQKEDHTVELPRGIQGWEERMRTVKAVKQYSLKPAQVKDFYRAFAVDRSQADFDMMVGVKNLYLRDIL